MSGDSLVAGSLMVADYVVFALVLVVSISIGVYFAWASRGQESSRHFPTGGRRLTALPVSISLTASFMSSITVLSNTAEVYSYGAIFIYFGLCYILSVVVASEVFIPVFYRLNVTSTYEAALTTCGATGGPLLGIFILGILCPFANSTGALSGLLTGLAASSCLSIGGLIYPPSPAMTQPLPLTTEGCNFTTTDSPNWTSTVLPTEPSSIITSLVQNGDGKDLLGDTWHSPSYLYFGCIGTVTAVIVELDVSLLTGGWTSRVESRLTLMREDTTFYHLFMFIKNRVMRRTGKLNITMKRQKEVGETNPGFCDIEMDLVNTSPK